MVEEKCLFCEIVKGNIPSLKVYESEKVIAVLNIKPATKGQILIIPKEHHSFISSVPDDVLTEVMVAFKSISSILTQVFQCSGINLLYSMGSSAGQKIAHVSFDVIPRYAGDNVEIKIPEGKIDQEELIQNQKLILKAFEESTIKLLKAIKEGKIKVSDDIKEKAIKTLEKLEKERPPKNPLKKEEEKKVDILKLEDELNNL